MSLSLTTAGLVAPVAAGMPSADTWADLHAATGIAAYGWLLVALPLLGAAILLLGGRRTDTWGPLLAVGMSSAAFVVGVAAIPEECGARVDGHLLTAVFRQERRPFPHAG